MVKKLKKKLHKKSNKGKKWLKKIKARQDTSICNAGTDVSVTRSYSSSYFPLHNTTHTHTQKFVPMQKFCYRAKKVDM